MPKVSVILSSLNHEKYIKESIDSVLNQTYKDFELFIIDDASTDKSWEIIKSFNDKRIISIKNTQRMRGSYGFNKIIGELATGDFIAIHHSDDIWNKNKLELQIDFLEKNPSVGAVFSRASLIDEEGNVLNTCPTHFTSFDQPNRLRYEWLRHFFSGENGLCHPSAVIRKKTFDMSGLYDRRLGQICDFEMWVRIALNTEIFVLQEHLVRFRIRDNNLNQSANTIKSTIRTLNEFPILLENIMRINNPDEIFKIFPEIINQKSNNIIHARFLLCLFFIKEMNFPQKQFGLNLLYHLMTDIKSCLEIKNVFDFDYLDLINLSGEADIYNQTFFLNENNFKRNYFYNFFKFINERLLKR